MTNYDPLNVNGDSAEGGSEKGTPRRSRRGSRASERGEPAEPNRLPDTAADDSLRGTYSPPTELLVERAPSSARGESPA